MSAEGAGFSIDPAAVRAWKRYPEYKDSGVEWLGEVPAGWEIIRLKYAVRLISERETGGQLDRNYIGLENIESWSGRLIVGESPINPEGQSGCFRPGDVLFGKLRPYLAKVYKAAIDGICSTEILVLRPKQVGQDYLFYYLLNSEFIKAVNSSTYGAKMPRANWEYIGNLPIPKVPVNEQHTIAAFLDRETTRIDALIEKKQRFIELMEEKRQALITQTVTKGLDLDVEMKDSGVEWLGEVPAEWDVKKLRHSSIVKRGASPRPIDDPKYFDDFGEYGWVRISDVTASERYLERTAQYLSELGKSKSVPLEPGELILSMAGTVGKAIITKIKCCIHDGFVYFQDLEHNREYLYYVFLTGELYKGIGKLGTQLNLNTDTIGDIKVPVPPLSEQHTIAAFLDRETARIDALIHILTQQIEKLHEYRTALISAAVTGKIDVRGEVPAPP